MAESWATQQELTFLKYLGTYREGHELKPMRLRLLENDVKAAYERSDWGSVNRDTVLRLAEEMLAEACLHAEEASG